jgi:hypothetical protein
LQWLNASRESSGGDVYAIIAALSPFAVFESAFTAAIQPPIIAD